MAAATGARVFRVCWIGFRCRRFRYGWGVNCVLAPEAEPRVRVRPATETRNYVAARRVSLTHVQSEGANDWRSIRAVRADKGVWNEVTSPH
jgi:hypothetical protein